MDREPNMEHESCLGDTVALKVRQLRKMWQKETETDIDPTVEIDEEVKK